MASPGLPSVSDWSIPRTDHPPPPAYPSLQNVQDFRRRMEFYVDSSNDPDSGSPWPLVRMVRMQSSHWSALKTGTRLVDAPGE